MKFKTSLKSSTALIDLTPLVDVIFLMLIFFIVTSDILPFKSLNIENPKLAQDSAPIMTQLLLVMDAHQVMYLGSKKEIVDFESLKDQIQHKLLALANQTGGHEPTLVLSIDRHVDYGTFLRLFAIAQECCSRVRLVYQTEDALASME